MESQYARPQITGASAPPKSETQGITARIAHAHDLVSEIDGHVIAGGAVLWGPIPEDSPKPSPRAVANGVLAEAVDSLDNLIARLQQIAQRASRFRNL